MADEALIQAFEQFCGEARYRKFLKSLNDIAKYKRRLLYWQQDLWDSFARQHPAALALTYEQIAEWFQLCYIHKERLQKDTVPAIYGYWVFPDDYTAARKSRFPYANCMYCGDSVEEQRWKNREVVYCEKCREELHQWNEGRQYPIGLLAWQPGKLTVQEETEREKRRYWPFEVLPEEQRTDFHKQEIQLLADAHAAGHNPYVFASGSNYGFGAEDSRLAEFIHRGRRRYWEPWLSESGEVCRAGPVFGLPNTACVCVDGLGQMRTVAFRWLEGLSIIDVFAGYATDAATRAILVEESKVGRATFPRCPRCEIHLIVGFVTGSLIEDLKAKHGWRIARYDQVSKRDADAIVTGCVVHNCPRCKAKIDETLR